MMTAPAMALEVRVSPEQPRLGETLSVLVETDGEQAPTLRARGRSYETFAVGQNRYRAFIPTTPLDTPGSFAIEAQSGDQRQRVDVPLGDRNFTIQEIWLSPSVNAITGTDYEFDRMDDLKATVTPERLWTGPFIHPSDGPITTPYGVRTSLLQRRLGRQLLPPWTRLRRPNRCARRRSGPGSSRPRRNRGSRL